MQIRSSFGPTRPICHPSLVFLVSQPILAVMGRSKPKISFFNTNSLLVEANANKAFVDLDKLIFPLIIRFKQQGDKFMPLGMKNYKKLSDFLIDSKVPLPEKENVPVLINGNGEIIWVAGLRQDNRYKVTGTTKKVAIFELSI